MYNTPRTLFSNSIIGRLDIVNLCVLCVSAVNKEKQYMTYRRRYFTDEPVTTPQITEGAVTEDKLANDAVTSPKIKNATVQTEDIADKAVTLAKLGDDVPAVGIPDNSITGAKIALDTIEKQNMKSASIDTAELAPAAVTTEKIRDGNVTPAKLSFSVPSRPLTPPIATDEIANLAVTYEKIGNYSVNDEKLSNGAVTVPKVDAVNTPTDGQALTYEQASGRFKYAPAGGSKITLINPQTVFDETATSDRNAPLDVSAVVPATAVAVLVELHQDGVVPAWAQPSAQIQHLLGGIALTAYITGDVAGTHPHYQDNAGIVPVYSPQNIYLVINRVGVSTRVKVTMVGYLE